MKSIIPSTVLRSLFAMLALGVSDLPLQAADTAPPTIVVAKTEAQGIGHWQPAMGDGLAQMMITELNKLDNVKVLESVALDDLRTERNLGEAGEVAASEAVKKGQWKGADYTFKSVVTRFGSKQSNYGGGGAPVPVRGLLGGLAGSFSVNKSENEVQIDWRIVDNATREVVKGASGSAVGLETGGGFNFGSWGGHGFAGDKEFMGSALGKATVKAIAQIVESVKPIKLAPGGRSTSAAAQEVAALEALKATPGKVLAAPSTSAIVVSLGKKQGYKDGDTLKLYETVEIKDDKGAVAFTDEKLVGELTLKTVQDDRSLATYSGNLTVKAGWVVKSK